jgi:flavin reductase (DIM6/NTAB) family NADH-FMN oxidoreductase RutF
MNHQPINPEELKSVMRTWITGVAVVTGYHNGISHGMTANSFNSIALSPPTVLVALQKLSRTQQLVKAGQVFGISILSQSQQSIAERFAGQNEMDQARFDGIDTFTLETGAPLIKQALGFLDCKVIDTIEINQTTVFFGRVLAIQNGDHSAEPLLYFNREWRRLV